MYRYWDLGSKILFSLSLGILLFKYKKTLNIFSILAIMYTGILITTDTFYDRYILFFIPIIIMFLVTQVRFKKLDYLILSIFLFALLKWGMYMLFRSKNEPKLKPPSYSDVRSKQSAGPLNAEKELKKFKRKLGIKD